MRLDFFVKKGQANVSYN